MDDGSEGLVVRTGPFHVEKEHRDTGQGWGLAVPERNKREGETAVLSNQRERFVQELVKGKSQRAAYKAAYGAGQMCDKTIDNKASKLFAQPEVRERYEELRNKVIEKAEKETVATALEVLEELTAIARGSKEYPAYDSYGNSHLRAPTLASRMRALEAIGKHYKLFTDKVELTGALNTRPDLSGFSEAELRRLAGLETE